MRRRGFRMILTMRVYVDSNVRTTACLAMPTDRECVGYARGPVGRTSEFGRVPR